MITSTTNSQVKRLIQLQKKAKIRRENKKFIVEGIKMFLETPSTFIQMIYVSESFIKKQEHKELLKEVSYEVLSDSVFQHVSDTKTPQGILCVVSMFSYQLEELLVQRKDDSSGLWIILENLQDPGNLGTIFRTAEGAGVSGIIMDETTADIFQPKVIRSTMGSIYRMPFVVTESIKDTINIMQEKGIQIYAAYLKGSVSYDSLDYTAPSAFLIGNEGNGLKEETVELADRYIRIPMEGQLESLNAAVAAALLMYEANRQQRNSKKEIE